MDGLSEIGKFFLSVKVDRTNFQLETPTNEHVSAKKTHSKGDQGDQMSL
jgi:hypothetical protein